MTRRIRRTPYTTRVEQHGVRGFTVVNHMLLPKAFEASVEDDYWHLHEHVQLWDVATQRQVALRGPDAARLAQWMTPRDISRARAGQCLYTPLVDQDGGMVNDPVMLKLADDHFWFSIADSDVLLWAKGLAQGASLNVSVQEPDVSPLAVQGPKAEEVVAEVFGDAVRNLGFFRFGWFEFEGTSQLLARSGFSKQGGFEIYLNGSEWGETLWDRVWSAGQRHNIRPGCPNLIERIEGGLLSYGNDFTAANNPLECGLGEFCSLDREVESLSHPALRTIAGRGVEREMRGVMFDGTRWRSAIAQPWPVLAGDIQVGEVTSGIWSPRFGRHVGVSMIKRGHWDHGQTIDVMDPDGIRRPGEVRILPLR